MTYKDLNSILQYPMSPELVEMLDDGQPLTLKKYDAINAHFEERDRPWREAASAWFATQPSVDIPIRIAPSLPPGTIEIRGANGTSARIVNLKTD